MFQVRSLAIANRGTIPMVVQPCRCHSSPPHPKGVISHTQPEGPHMPNRPQIPSQSLKVYENKGGSTLSVPFLPLPHPRRSNQPHTPRGDLICINRSQISNNSPKEYKTGCREGFFGPFLPHPHPRG